jgi:lipid A 3-O-deacylase
MSRSPLANLPRPSAMSHSPAAGVVNGKWRRLARGVYFLLACAFPVSLTVAATELRPWNEQALSVERGLLWQVGKSTDLSYRLAPTELSWRSRESFGWQLLSGRLSVRNRLTLMGTWIEQGPESHYVALSASPSIEWWNRRGRWGAYSGAGGGFGWLDSQGVRGGQGQDFTLNWFARAGIEHHGSRYVRWTAGVMFQHMSNGGQTNPNPGIDALGMTLGWTWSF